MTTATEARARLLEELDGRVEDAATELEAARERARGERAGWARKVIEAKAALDLTIPGSGAEAAARHRLTAARRAEQEHASLERGALEWCERQLIAARRRLDAAYREAQDRA